MLQEKRRRTSLPWLLAVAMGTAGGLLVGAPLSANPPDDCETNICNLGTGNCALAPEEEWNCAEILGGCNQSACDQ